MSYRVEGRVDITINRLNLWFIEDQMNGRMFVLRFLNSGVQQWSEMEEGSEMPEPSLSLDLEMAHPLMVKLKRLCPGEDERDSARLSGILEGKESQIYFMEQMIQQLLGTRTSQVGELRESIPINASATLQDLGNLERSVLSHVDNRVREMLTQAGVFAQSVNRRDPSPEYSVSEPVPTGEPSRRVMET